MGARRFFAKFRRRHGALYVACIACCFLGFLRALLRMKQQSARRSTLVCPSNPLATDITLVLRTGATEILEKLPVHFDTTLQCVPNYVIFSDYEEEIQGKKVHDVFDDLSPELDSVPDFELYHQLKSSGRNGISVSMEDLRGSGSSGSLQNPGWKLDKFKFLPMMEKALSNRPQAKWFVFVELDTYLIWSNLLDYLSKFDADTPYYIGKQMYIGDVLFAHGGSGFALSVAAMRKLTVHWRNRMQEYNQYTIEQWAGDMVLGKVLKDAGIQLLWAFPHFQGDPVSTLDHNVTKIDKQPWCHPALTYHHMSTDEIRSLWEFEQELQREKAHHVTLRHSNVFKEYIMPRLSRKRKDWDNYSVSPDFTKELLGDQVQLTSLTACRSACELDQRCLQFSYHASTCSLSNEVRLGRKSRSQCLEYSPAASKCEKTGEKPVVIRGSERDPVYSGWMMGRIESYVTAMDLTCDGQNAWIT